MRVTKYLDRRWICCAIQLVTSDPPEGIREGYCGLLIGFSRSILFSLCDRSPLYKLQGTAGWCGRYTIWLNPDSAVWRIATHPDLFVKGKAIPLQAWTGFQEVEIPRFQDSRLMRVVRLSALHTGRLYLPGNIPGNRFC